MSLRGRGKPERIDGIVLAPGPSLLNEHREGAWRGDQLVLSLLPLRRHGSSGDPDGAVMTAYLGAPSDSGFAAAVAEWNRRRQLVDPVLGAFRHDPVHDRHHTIAGWRGARVKLILEVAERGGAPATLAIAHALLDAADYWHDRIGERLASDLPAAEPAAAGLNAEALFARLAPRTILVRDRDDVELHYDDDGLFDGRTVIAVVDLEAGQVREVLIAG